MQALRTIESCSTLTELHCQSFTSKWCIFIPYRRVICGPNTIDVPVIPIWKLLIKEVKHFCCFYFRLLGEVECTERILWILCLNLLPSTHSSSTFLFQILFKLIYSPLFSTLHPHACMAVWYLYVSMCQELILLALQGSVNVYKLHWESNLPGKGCLLISRD